MNTTSDSGIQKDLLMKPFLNMNDPVGIIELNVNLPSTIADVYRTVLAWKTSAASTHPMDLIALAHYNACKQLYATLNNETKSRLLPFQLVNKEVRRIPKRMSQAISIIGNFQIESGNIVLSHPVVLFKRWLCAAFISDRTCTRNIVSLKTQEFQDAYKWVWSDAASKELVDELCLNFIVRQGNKLAGPASVFSPTKENIESWCSDLCQSFPEAASLIIVGKLYMLSLTAWSTRDYDEEEIDKALNLIGCAKSTVTDQEMIEGLKKLYDDSARKRPSRYHDLVSSDIETIPYEPKRYGTPAQLVSSFTDKAEWGVYISDSDARFGFLLNPCANFTFNPRFMSYSTQKLKDAQIDYFKQDFGYPP